MAGKQKDRLRILLRQVELPAPAVEFTNEVMRETSPLSEESPLDVHLKTVLQDIRLVEPSVDFTYNVQKKIKKLAQPPRSKPVITSGAWIGVGIFLGICVAMSINPSHDNPADGPIYFTTLADQLTKLTTTFREPIFYFEVVLLSAAMLLGLERILRKRLHRI